MISEKNEREDGSSSCSNTVQLKFSIGLIRGFVDKHTLGMLIAESTFSHVCELDGAFATGVHEPIAALRVKFCGSDDLCKLLHVSRLDIHNVEALVLNVEVP